MDMKGTFPSQSNSVWSLHRIRSHAYKLAIITIIFIISLQFSLQFTSYNNRLMGLNYFMIPQSMPFTDARRVNFSNLNSLNGRILDPQIYSDDLPNDTIVSNDSSLPPCPLVPPKLVGRLKVLIDEVPATLTQVEESLPFIKTGGTYSPPTCKSPHKVAIIIPYRDRPDHLRIFLHNIHPVLSRQNIDYGIFVVEEVPGARFNRAKLLNVGYKEALKLYDYQCFIFHDVDLIPEDDRNLYTCPDQPRHMSVAVSTMNYKLPYKDIFGGVSALTASQFEKVNGFSNQYWGWGAEDDDMSARVRFNGLKITRYSPVIARYFMLNHKKDSPNPDRYKKLYASRQRMKKDGLNTLSYKVLSVDKKKLFTRILVDLLESEKN